MFTFITVLGGMVKSSTQATWWAILFRLLVMCVVLILISARIILKVLPAMGMSSELLRTLPPASALVCIQLVPLDIWLMCTTILCTILLWCASLIAVILKLTLTILRSLSSISWYKSSKLLVSALTIIRTVASTLTWGIVVIIVGAFIIVSLIHLLDFWWVLSLILRFSFRFTSTSGLFRFCAFKRLRYISLFYATECAMWEYNPSMLHLLPSLVLLEWVDCISLLYVLGILRYILPCPNLYM